MRNASVVKINCLVLSASLSVNRLATSTMPRNAYTDTPSGAIAPRLTNPDRYLSICDQIRARALFGRRLRRTCYATRRKIFFFFWFFSNDLSCASYRDSFQHLAGNGGGGRGDIEISQEKQEKWNTEVTINTEEGERNVEIVA